MGRRVPVERRAAMRELGCDWVQGHLIALPLSDAEMGTLLSPAHSPSWHETRAAPLGIEQAA